MATANQKSRARAHNAPKQRSARCKYKGKRVAMNPKHGTTMPKRLHKIAKKHRNMLELLNP